MNNKKILGNIAQAVDNPLNYKFDKIKNKNTKLSYNIRITVPEFTSICPVTSQPDFALIVIDYIPKLICLHHKRIKLLFIYIIVSKILNIIILLNCNTHWEITPSSFGRINLNRNICKHIIYFTL